MLALGLSQPRSDSPGVMSGDLNLPAGNHDCCVKHNILRGWQLIRAAHVVVCRSFWFVQHVLLLPGLELHFLAFCLSALS